MDRAWVDELAAIRVTPPISPVPINVGARRVGDADHEHPVSLLQRVLEIAADAQSTIGIKHIEAGSVRPRRILRRVIAVINAKHPFLLTSIARALALSEPVHVARSFPAG